MVNIKQLTYKSIWKNFPKLFPAILIFAILLFVAGLGMILFGIKTGDSVITKIGMVSLVSGIFLVVSCLYLADGGLDLPMNENHELDHAQNGKASSENTSEDTSDSILQAIYQLEKAKQHTKGRIRLNFLLGFAFSIFALLFLLFPDLLGLDTHVVEKVQNVSLTEKIINRLSPVIFIEVIVIFFFRSYRNEIKLLKSYEHELTTILLRKHAIDTVSNLDESKELESTVIASLIQADRAEANGKRGRPEESFQASLSQLTVLMKWMRTLDPKYFSR